MKISVVTINFNNVEGLKKTIDSVLNQTYKDIEYVIIDGGSNDTSKTAIEQHAANLSFWVSEKDKGIYNAQNKGILNATGTYCLFLNSGDALAGPAVLKQAIAAGENTDIVYGDLITIDREGLKTHLSSPDVADATHFMVSTLWHPTAFIKRELFNTLGLYNESFKITGDYEFFIRSILKHHVSTKHINLPVSIFDMSGVSNAENMQALQDTERRQSWALNFSEAAIKKIEAHTRFIRSRKYTLVKLIKKIFKPFSK